MSEKVKPLQVSPLIKSCRYIFLISGIVYGVMKCSAYRAYEVAAKPKRLQMYKEQHEREYQQMRKEMIDEIYSLMEAFEIKDVTPEWEDDFH